jgi:predicted dehydrogenase
MGVVNAQAARKECNAEITAVFDSSATAARRLARECGCPVASSAEELVNHPSVDAVMISTPHDLHFSLGMLAASSKKHIFMEKPLCVSLEEARGLIDHAARNNVNVSCNYWYRYLPSTQFARTLVAQGALGTILGIQVEAHQFKSRSYWLGSNLYPNNWRARLDRAGGGMLIMTTCHAIDLVRFISGIEVESVCSDDATLATEAQVEDIQAAILKLEGGAFGSVFTSSCLRGTRSERQTLWGTHGTLQIQGTSVQFYSTKRIGAYRPGYWHSKKCAAITPQVGVGHALRQFFASVSDGTPLEISPHDCFTNLAVVLTCYRSKLDRRFLDVPSLNELVPSCRANS